MENSDSLWLVPISVTPGLGMLVLSTSARYMAVASQLREFREEPQPEQGLWELIYKRACCLQLALLSLYASIACFIFAGMLRAFAAEYVYLEVVSLYVMVFGGIAAMYATCHLAFEVHFSRKIIEHDFVRNCS